MLDLKGKIGNKMKQIGKDHSRIYTNESRLNIIHYTLARIIVKRIEVVLELKQGSNFSRTSRRQRQMTVHIPEI